MDTHFKNKDRIEVVIFKASNVLTPKALQEVTIKIKESEKQSITKVVWGFHPFPGSDALTAQEDTEP